MVFAPRYASSLQSCTKQNKAIQTRTGGGFNIKMSSCYYRKSRCGDGTIL